MGNKTAALIQFIQIMNELGLSANSNNSFSVERAPNQCAYYGKFIDNKSPYIGNKILLNFYQKVSKKLGFTVANATRNINKDECCLVNLILNNNATDYLKSMAPTLKLFPKRIETVSPNILCLDSDITFIPLFSNKEQFRTTIKKYALEVLKLQFTLWSQEKDILTLLPMTQSETAVEMFLSIYDINVHQHIHSIPNGIEKETSDCLALLLKPNKPLLEWLNQSNEYLDYPAEDLSIYNLEVLRSACTAIIIPYLKSSREADSFFKKHWQKIFETELDSWCSNKNYWPADRRIEVFCEWFDFDYHDTAFNCINSK